MRNRIPLMTLQIAAWMSILWIGLAWGQTYRWTDHQGIVHFTDNASRIPSAYRATVVEEKAVASPPPTALIGDSTKAIGTNPAPAGASPSPVPQRDRLGRGPDYWGTLAQHWSIQLQHGLEERDRLQLLHVYTRQLANGTRDVWDRGRLESEVTRLETAIAEVEAQIKAADVMLQSTLPLEAVKFGADPTWLTPKPSTSTPQ